MVTFEEAIDIVKTECENLGVGPDVRTHVSDKVMDYLRSEHSHDETRASLVWFVRAHIRECLD